jgi:hypothetical protein
MSSPLVIELAGPDGTNGFVMRGGSRNGLADLITGAAFSPSPQQGTVRAGESHVALGQSSAVITGAATADRLRGDAAPNQIEGLGGADRLEGLGGDDTLLGGDSRDQLLGGDGDDILDGGRERDVAIGGAGADVFVLDDTDSYDLIRDFSVAEGDSVRITAAGLWGADGHIGTSLLQARDVGANLLLEFDADVDATNGFQAQALATLYGAAGLSLDEVIADAPDQLSFTFEEDAAGWEAGFADLPAGELGGPLFDLVFDRAEVPGPGAEPVGLELAGSNRSDDLFMFVKREITGLEPGSEYRVDFDFEIYTNAGEGCVGIGGAPGESVHVKAGAVPFEPLAVRRGDALVMNLDKGDQAQGGDDAVVLGDLAAAGANCEGTVFVPKQFASTPGTITARADADGSLWVFIGTDSGFEGRTELFLTKIELVLREVSGTVAPLTGHGGLLPGSPTIGVGAAGLSIAEPLEHGLF